MSLSKNEGLKKTGVSVFQQSPVPCTTRLSRALDYIHSTLFDPNFRGQLPNIQPSISEGPRSRMNGIGVGGKREIRPLVFFPRTRLYLRNGPTIQVVTGSF